MNKLDSEIRLSMLDFVRCGRALLQMRDSQAYMDHYATFEEYLKAVEGLSITVGQERVRQALVFDSLGPGLPGPKTISLTNALTNAAVFIEDKRTVTGPSGKERTIKQPTAVKNPKALQRIWGAAVKEHERIGRGLRVGFAKLSLSLSASQRRADRRGPAGGTTAKRFHRGTLSQWREERAGAAGNFAPARNSELVTSQWRAERAGTAGGRATNTVTLFKLVDICRGIRHHDGAKAICTVGQMFAEPIVNPSPHRWPCGIRKDHGRSTAA